MWQRCPSSLATSRSRQRGDRRRSRRRTSPSTPPRGPAPGPRGSSARPAEWPERRSCSTGRGRPACSRSSSTWTSRFAPPINCTSATPEMTVSRSRSVLSAKSYSSSSGTSPVSARLTIGCGVDVELLDLRILDVGRQIGPDQVELLADVGRGDVHVDVHVELQQRLADVLHADGVDVLQPVDRDHRVLDPLGHVGLQLLGRGPRIDRSLP